jgi:hypothetical protein
LACNRFPKNGVSTPKTFEIREGRRSRTWIDGLSTFLTLFASLLMVLLF